MSKFFDAEIIIFGIEILINFNRRYCQMNRCGYSEDNTESNTIKMQTCIWFIPHCFYFITHLLGQVRCSSIPVSNNMRMDDEFVIIVFCDAHVMKLTC